MSDNNMDIFSVEETEDLFKEFGIEAEDVKPLDEISDPEEDDNKPDDINTDTELEKEPVKEEAKKESTTPPTEVLKDTKDNSSSNTTILSSIVDVLQEEGFLNLKEGEKVESAEDFVKVIEAVKDSALESEQIDWTDTQKEYFEAVRNGVPHEQIVQHQQAQQAYSSITDEAIEEEDNLTLRENLITNFYKDKGFSDKKIARDLKRIKDDGGDIEEAKEALEYLQESESNQFKARVENEKAASVKSQQATKKLREDFNKYVQETQEILPDTKIAPSMRKELIKGLTKPAGYTEDGRPLDAVDDFIYKNGYQAKYKLAYILKLTDGLKDMSKLSANKAKKDVTSKLDTLLKSNSDTSEFSKEQGSDTLMDDLKDWDKFLKD